MLAFAVLIAVNAMWAFQFSGARIATRELGPVLVTLLPMAIATLLVMPFTELNWDMFRRGNRIILFDVFLLGTFGIVPAQLFLVYGVERTLASNASVIALTVPVLTALSASIFLHERLTKLRLLSFIIAIVGVCIISMKDIQHARLFRLEYMAGNLSCSEAARAALSTIPSADALSRAFHRRRCWCGPSSLQIWNCSSSVRQRNEAVGASWRISDPPYGGALFSSRFSAWASPCCSTSQ